MLGDSANVMYALLIIEWIGLDVIEVEDVVLTTLELHLLLKTLELHLLLKTLELHLLPKRIEFLLLLHLPHRISTNCLHWSQT